MKRTPAGMAHAQAPVLPPHLVITLKAGWRLQSDGSLAAGPKRRLSPPLPAGAWLEPAVALPPGPLPAEAEARMQRCLHLRLPAGADAARALQQVRAWACVQRAEVAPQVCLP